MDLGRMPKGTAVNRLIATGLIVAALGACSESENEPVVLPAPSNVQVQQLSLTSVRISWDPVPGAASYVVERASQDAPDRFSARGRGITATEYADTGLTTGVTYLYRVAAEKGGTVGDFSQPVPIATGLQQATLSGNITRNRTLRADTVYVLSGYVKVTNGAILTIEPGTKIVGDSSVPGSSLWILRGSKLIAEGTPDRPIVFTSQRSPGNRAPGDWGGIVIIGNGIINRTGSAIFTEGPSTVAENYAGGTDNNDNSGSLRYVRIEFAGYDVSGGAGQELNGLSMYAVGSGTRLEYVQVIAGLDDSFEFWGGAVQGRYLISYESADDHFDWSEGWQGKLQYIIAFQSTRLTPRPGTGTVASDPRGVEADGCDPALSGCSVTTTGASTPYSNPTVANFTFVGPGDLAGFPSDGNGVVLRRGSGGWLQNGIIARYKGVAIDLRDAWTDSLRLRDTLAIKNVILAENGQNYNGDGDANRYGQASKFASSNHRIVSTAASLFTSLNPENLDWTPPPGSPATTGGGTIPPARASNFFGGSMESTTYVGAASPSGPKWWLPWSVYFRN
jgi:hypothetical protein